MHSMNKGINFKVYTFYQESDLAVCEVTIDRKYFPEIIGKSGKIINKMREDYKVYIIIAQVAVNKLV